MDNCPPAKYLPEDPVVCRVTYIKLWELIAWRHTVLQYVTLLRCMIWRSHLDGTLPETNIAPETTPSQNESSLPNIHFEVRTVSFRECPWPCSNQKKYGSTQSQTPLWQSPNRWPSGKRVTNNFGSFNSSGAPVNQTPPCETHTHKQTTKGLNTSWVHAVKTRWTSMKHSFRDGFQARIIIIAWRRIKIMALDLYTKQSFPKNNGGARHGCQRKNPKVSVSSPKLR